MQYKYCSKQNFEELSSGRVIYGNAGIPNFSVRLLNEIFSRCLEYTERSTGLTVYDPCCGGGYSLTVLGFCHADRIAGLIGSDIDEAMVSYARKNTGLLTNQGLNNRILELEEMMQLYHKQSHKEALQSAYRWKEQLNKELPAVIFQADCTKTLPDMGRIDVILTDVPYGGLVDWQSKNTDPLSAMAEQLAKIASPGTVLAVSMDKKQSMDRKQSVKQGPKMLGQHDLQYSWARLEKQLIGKSKFEIYRLDKL